MLRFLVAIVTMGWALPAAADVPPEPGFVETCTVEKQQELGGGPCEVVSMLQGQVDPAVAQRLTSSGLQHRCAGGGATVGHAVYCRGAATRTAPPAASTSLGGGCGGCAVTSRPDRDLRALGAALAMVAVLITRRAWACRPR